MNRIEGYDLARALAIFGMVVVNFKIAMAVGAWGVEAQAGPGWLHSLTGLLDGRAAAVFVVLAGVGMTLGARRALSSGVAAELRATRVTLWKRAAFLFVGGMLFSLVWDPDILHFYGWYIGISALLIGCRNRTLLWLAALLVMAFAGMVFTLDYEAGWDFDTLTYSGFWTVAGQTRNLFFNGFHPVVPWLAFLLVGIWLGRQDMLNPSVRRRVLIIGAGVALVTEAVSATLVELLTRNASAADAELIGELLGTEVLPPMPLYMLAAGGTALAVISLCVGFSQRFPDAPGHRALIAAGRLSLTIYVGHVILGLGILEAVGRLEGQSLWFAVTTAVAFYVLAVSFALLWTRRWSYGPLEWVMRRVAG